MSVYLSLTLTLFQVAIMLFANKVFQNLAYTVARFQHTNRGNILLITTVILMGISYFHQANNYQQQVSITASTVVVACALS